MYKLLRKQKRNWAIGAGIVLSLLFIMVALLAPTMAIVAGSALAIVPFWGSVEEGTFKEISPEEIEKLETAEQVKYFNALNKSRALKLDKMKTELKEATSAELKSEIAALKTEINKSNLEQMGILQKAMEEQGMALKTLLQKDSKKSNKSLESILEEKKNELKELAGQSNKSIKFTVDKATVLTTSVADSTLAYVDNTIGILARARNVIRQLFSTGSISAGMGGTVRWIEYVLDTNGAAWQTEGVLKGEGAMTWIEKSLSLQNIAEWIKVSRQMLTDFNFVASEIRNKLMRDLESKIDGDLFDGTGTSPEIKGIYTYADSYTAVASGITDASIFDLIVKVEEDITESSNYLPNFCIMNSADINLMKLKKDSNNNYILPPFVSPDGKKVDMVTVIESSKVTANTMLIGDFDYATLYNLGGVEITMGYENQDFTKNLVTILAEERLGLLVKGTDTDAFRKVESISAALTTLAS